MPTKIVYASHGWKFTIPVLKPCNLMSTNCRSFQATSALALQESLLWMGSVNLGWKSSSSPILVDQLILTAVVSLWAQETGQACPHQELSSLLPTVPLLMLSPTESWLHERSFWGKTSNYPWVFLYFHQQCPSIFIIGPHMPLVNPQKRGKGDELTIHWLQ